MTSDDDRPTPPHFGPLRALGWIFVVGLLSAGLLVGALLYRLLAPEPEPETRVEVLRESPDVIVAVRDLARLETARFHMERVIDLRDRQSSLFGLVTATDAILLVAAAEVSAGVDLTRMSDGDIVLEEREGRRSARILLPAPEVFDAHLDTERTYVHTRDTDPLAQRGDHLETRARQEAARSLRASALEGGILERARENAESTIRTLVEALGYDEVSIEFADGPATGDEAR